MPKQGMNRWLVAVMGTVLQIMLGTVYAWSFFQEPIMQACGWTNVQVMWIFSIAICSLGLAAAAGGLLMAKQGPLKLALTGALLYGSGYLLGGWAMSAKSLPLLYLGFGVVGGIGLGLGYVTPVATAAKWFPDKKGFVTGMVIMGFGLGALLMSKAIAPTLMKICGGNLVHTFWYAGGILLAIGLPAAAFMRNPPEGYQPPPAAAGTAAKKTGTASVPVFAHAGHALLSGRFIRMWLLLFLNTSAGIMFIGLQSPMLQDLLRRSGSTRDAAALAAIGATLIGVSALFNGIGRFFWGGISDKIGRTNTFRLIFASQILIFIALIWTSNPWLFGVLVCYVLLCYGGGFGTMPSYIGDTFGAQMMPVVYGTVLTAWSMAGIVGLQLAAFLKDRFGTGSPTWTYLCGAILLTTGLVIALTLDDHVHDD